MDLIKTEQFLKVRKSREKIYFGFLMNYASDNTKIAYKRDLSDFLSFLKDHFPHLDEFSVEHAHIVAYKNFLIQKHKERGDFKETLAKRTINRKLACLGAFYGYLYDQGHIEKKPTDRVQRFRFEKQVVTNDLEDDQVAKIISAPDMTTGPGKLHRAILRLLFSTGMRHGELTGLKMENLHNINNYQVIKYTAKGGKQMTTPLNQACLNDLGMYLNWCQEQGYSMTPKDYLFRPTRNPNGGNLNKQLDPKSIDYIVKKYAKQIGIKGKVTAHSARATVIGMLLDKGMSIDKVADFVGHKDITTTKAYHKRKSHLAHSPIFDLDF